MKQYQRILLLKMDHIGDALWSFPAIAALRQACPDAWIGMLCTPYLAEVYQPLDLLSEVIQYDPHANLAGRLAILRQLRRRSPDLAIVLGPVDKINHLAWLSGAKERVGYAYAGNPLHSLTRQLFLTRWQSHPADVARSQGQSLPHEVPAMLSLLTVAEVLPATAISNWCPSAKLFFPVASAERDAAMFRLSNLLPGKSRFAAIHLCAKAFPFGWNEQFVCALAEKLRGLQPDVGWFVTAGPSEQAQLEPYRQSFAKIGLPLLAGLDLPAMAALLSPLDCLVSWDTGVVHLATAVGTPVVDIFTARDFEYCLQRWGPWDSGSIPLPQAESVAGESLIAAILVAAAPLLR